MRHQRAGKKLGRDSAHRKALYANLAGALIEHGRIKTTEAKAKAVKPLAEQMITLGRRGDLSARRQAISTLRSNDVVHQLFADVAPRFARPARRLHADRQARPAPGRRGQHGVPRARGLRAARRGRRPHAARVGHAAPRGGAACARPRRGGRLAHRRAAAGSAHGGGGRDARARDRRRRRLRRERRQLERGRLLFAELRLVAARAGPSSGRQSCRRHGLAGQAVRPRRLRRGAQRVRARRRRLADAQAPVSARSRWRSRPPRRRLRRRRRRPERQRTHDARLRHAHGPLANAAWPFAAAAPGRHGGARPHLRDRRPRDRDWTRTSGSSSRGRRASGAGVARRRCPMRAAAPAPRRSAARSSPWAARRPAAPCAASTRTTSFAGAGGGSPDLPTPRHGVGVAALGGTVYVIGGGPQPGLFVSDANESLRIR